MPSTDVGTARYLLPTAVGSTLPTTSTGVGTARYCIPTAVGSASYAGACHTGRVGGLQKTTWCMLDLRQRFLGPIAGYIQTLSMRKAGTK